MCVCVCGGGGGGGTPATLLHALSMGGVAISIIIITLGQEA